MARPRKKRTVESPPQHFNFYPEVSPEDRAGLEIKQMTLDEYEAFRLVDYLGNDHKTAADIMGISRPSLTRLITRARQDLSHFIIEGGKLEIRGGQISFSTQVFCCHICHRPFRWEEEGKPVCPECGSNATIVPHQACQGVCSCCEKMTQNRL